MKLFAHVLVVLGVCVGALGASGFHPPADGEGSRESGALPLFALGATSLAVGGFLVRQARRGGVDPQSTQAEKLGYLRQFEAIQRVVVALDRDAAQLDGPAVRDRIAELQANEMFDLTSRSDDLALLLGFEAYARVWEGLATAERLLARCWSMCTDGYPEEGKQELPHARTALDRAVEQMRSV